MLRTNQGALGRVHLRVEERVDELGAAVEEIPHRLGSTEYAVHAKFFLAAVGALGHRRMLLDEAHEGRQRGIRGGREVQAAQERILRDRGQLGCVEPAFGFGGVVEARGNHAGAQAQLGLAFGFGALGFVEYLGGDIADGFGFLGRVDDANQPGGRVV